MLNKKTYIMFVVEICSEEFSVPGRNDNDKEYLKRISHAKSVLRVSEETLSFRGMGYIMKVQNKGYKMKRVCFKIRVKNYAIIIFYR